MLSLSEKLKTINQPQIQKLKNGDANSLDEFWNSFIKNYIPNSNTLKNWHKLLIAYKYE